MFDTLRVMALIGATITTGLMAGVFGIYAVAVMPGLRRTDDRTFVGAFQATDRAIMNPLFMATFLGALLLSLLATVLYLGEDERSVLPWVAAATVLYLIVFVITLAVNVPLNDQIKAAGDPDLIDDLGAVRERFQEIRWNGWNVVRATLTTIGFGSLSWALVLYGRITASS